MGLPTESLRVSMEGSPSSSTADWGTNTLSSEEGQSATALTHSTYESDLLEQLETRRLLNVGLARSFHYCPSCPVRG